QECLDVARRAHVPLHLAHCPGNFPQNRGRAPEVLDAIDEALPLLRSGAAQFHLAEACRVRASILLKLGRLDDAAAQAAESLNRARDLGDGQTESASLKVLGRVRQQLGDDERALDLLTRADHILVNVDDQGGRIPLLDDRAASLVRLGRPEEAGRCRRLAEELRHWLARPAPSGG
ncbi:tetratricopeptide repeat protein, partial [Actinocorallia lasiicapitis]